jgi:hypothetical protein
MSAPAKIPFFSRPRINNIFVKMEDFPLNTETYDFIGIREFKHVDYAIDNGSREVTRYYVYLSQEIDGETQKYLLQIDNHYHDCQSGYCDATTFTMQQIRKIDGKVGTIHYRLRGDLTQKVKLVKVNSDNMPDILDYALETIDGTRIISCSIFGNDRSYEYYPDGFAKLELETLVPTIRLPKLRLVYVFIGDSHDICSSITDLQVYNTDSNSELPKDIYNNHVIVIGDKYPDHHKLVLTALSSKNIQIVLVTGNPSSLPESSQSHVFMFTGASCIGKSFVASHLTNLEVYESDMAEELPENLSDNKLIVIGNKYHEHRQLAIAFLSLHNIPVIEFIYKQSTSIRAYL